MYLRTTLVLAAALALCADLADTTHFVPPLPGVPTPGTMPNQLPLPDVMVSVVQHSGNQQADLQAHSRLEIVRYVSGEFAKAVKPLPSGKKGFKIEVGKPIDDRDLQRAIRSEGAAASPGDTVQITNIEFRGKEIVIQINGGGKKKFRLADHLQIGYGGNTSAPPPADASNSGSGSTLYLEYGRDLPDMSPDDLMHDLSPFLDFSKERSAAVNWVDTLPPQFKEGIKNHEAVEGMDHEMVLAALGRPDHKVRERTPSGDQTEDWIYGMPPAKTVFVTFAGDKVIRVKEYD